MNNNKQRRSFFFLFRTNTSRVFVYFRLIFTCSPIRSFPTVGRRWEFSSAFHNIKKEESKREGERSFSSFFVGPLRFSLTLFFPFFCSSASFLFAAVSTLCSAFAEAKRQQQPWPSSRRCEACRCVRALARARELTSAKRADKVKGRPSNYFESILSAFHASSFSLHPIFRSPFYLSFSSSLFRSLTHTSSGLHLRHPRRGEQGGRADARREGARQDQEEVCNGHGRDW